MDKKRIIWVLLFILLSGFLATSLFSYFVARTTLTQQITERSLPLVTDKIHSELTRDLLVHIVIASQMAENSFVLDWLKNGEKKLENIEEYLRLIKEKNRTFTAFLISEKSRRYYHPNGELRYVKESNLDDDWYFKTKKLNKKYDVIISEDEMNQKSLSIFINHLMFDRNDSFIGITGVGLNLNTVQSLINKYHKQNNITIYISDLQGNVIFNDITYSGNSSIHTNENLSIYANQILDSKRNAITYKRDGKTVFLNSRLIEEYGWLLIVEESEEVIGSPIMNTLIGNLLGALFVTFIVLFLSHLTIKGYQKRLEEMAAIDPLSKALNRRSFDMLYKQVMKSTQRGSYQTFSVTLFDIDDFKKINDTYGHLAGDKVIAYVSNIIRKNIRESDFFCRWGGEEFLLLLPECDANAAMAISEKIRSLVENARVQFDESSIAFTISAGVASYREEDDCNSLVRRADEGLYIVKQSGKNKVELKLS